MKLDNLFNRMHHTFVNILLKYYIRQLNTIIQHTCISQYKTVKRAFLFIILTTKELIIQSRINFNNT